MYLALLAAMPVAIALLALAVPGSDGLGPSDDPTSVEATRLLVLLTVGAAFLGLSATIRDLVAERSIFYHERDAGLSSLGYLAGEVFVFTILASAQACLLVALVLGIRGGPLDALVLPTPNLEIAAVISLTAAVGAALGLAVSSRVRTSEQTMPPLVLLVMGQLVLCGGLLPLDGRGPLETVAAIFPTRWGYAAAAATSDLNNSSPAVDPDPIWVHTAANWTGCVLVLFALWMVGIGMAAAGVLGRRRVG